MAAVTHIALFALVICAPQLVAAQGRALLQSTCANEGGTCKDTSLCAGGRPVAGLCPGAANIQCCYPGAGSACSGTPGGSGTCLVEGRQACSGTFYAEFCPGPAKVKCCAGGTSGVAYYTAIVGYPAGIRSNPTQRNGLTSGQRSTLQRIFGTPCSSPTSTCKGISAGTKTARNQYTLNVGPFTVTGLRPAVEALKRVFDRVRANDPGLYKVVRNLGMACCRYTARTTSYSTHSWGSAIDIQIGSTSADLNKDNKTYRGLVLLYPYFNAEGFYWGAGFSTNEDPVHYEVSEQKLLEWERAGRFVA